MNTYALPYSRPLSLWLFTCAGFVFAMVVVGAITRLTESGLSMVEWRPLLGALPPLSDAEWERVFALYKDSPEYLKKNFWMTLTDFKHIFFWEWFHRLLGRTIGLVYALPLVFFWLKAMIPQGYKPKLLGLLALGGVQGLMGWIMVRSGLVDQPAVSHYRLAAHLLLALLIFSLLLRLGHALRGIDSRPHRPLYLHGWITLIFAVCTILWGALTAGMDAGLVYNNTFPKMGAGWVPPEILQYSPLYLSFFEDHAGIQFMHRWLGIVTVSLGASLWLHAVSRRHSFPQIHALGLMVFVQLGLGITTLFSGVALLPAALHQTGAVVILGLLVISLQKLKG